ncbi:MAG: hypothetical protein H7X70_06520, partial [Candidatus Kapabacteria bacterium]|nr:hypothetical protein [Candidatus Kapabacteria bacterium]
MPKQKVDLRKVFQPSDSIAFLVIVIGLFIALFLDEMSVRLIGICITVLGGVALFMIVSPRLTDLQIIAPVRPSQTADLGSRTVQDGQKRSQTFDPEAYRESFGISESDESQFVDENQIDLFDGQAELVRKPVAPPETIVDQFDSESGIRILSTRSGAKTAPPKLVSEMRQERIRKDQAEMAQKVEAEQVVFSSSTAVITGPVTNEIQLSEDVIVRPLSRTKPTPVAPVEPVVAVAPEVEVEAIEEEVVAVEPAELVEVESTIETPELTVDSYVDVPAAEE